VKTVKIIPRRNEKDMHKHATFTITLLLLASFLLGACSAQAGAGTLNFLANGEDFVRQGFTSKDGWEIRFDHVFVTLAEITAYQTDPPYDPHDGGEISAETSVRLGGVHTIDLAEGGEEADPILVGEIADAPAGHYNAISWKMTPPESGPAAGYPLVIIGQAQKDGRSIDFTIKIEKPYRYACGDYVGDERKGILAEDGIADLEMTFHFDHIFGDADTPPDDDLNLSAPGFDPIAAAASGDTLDMDLAQLERALTPEQYQMLIDILTTLGHVGEGHCHSES
jgi:hypothetical protein